MGKTIFKAKQKEAERTAAIPIVLFLLAALFVLIPKKVCVSAKTTGMYTEAIITLRLLFGLVGISAEARASIRIPGGARLSVNGRPVRLPPREKRKGGMRLMRAVAVKELSVTGEVGLDGAPDVSVILAGILQTLLSQAAAALVRERAAVRVAPRFDRAAFVLNVEGIFCVSAGRMIIEAIKLRRKKANESSDRKHNAVVDGAYQEAR
ncbi:MAG: hypothetical protein J5586_06230 [Clostridia bacterium]|nr:hypothetical protein [Clostridia bacterium]